ncbi:MAG: hypothetical protein R2688_00275 [Fimbriimonadaceae bacterium]
MDANRAHEVMDLLVEPGQGFRIHNTLIQHGRQTCMALIPNCAACVIQDECRWFKRVGPEKLREQMRKSEREENVFRDEEAVERIIARLEKKCFRSVGDFVKPLFENQVFADDGLGSLCEDCRSSATPGNLISAMEMNPLMARIAADLILTLRNFPTSLSRTRR